MLAMIISSLSVMIQVAYCNMSGGRRLFKMSPLHHHFELCGMSEPRIVAMYTLMSVVTCLLRCWRCERVYISFFERSYGRAARRRSRRKRGLETWNLSARECL